MARRCIYCGVLTKKRKKGDPWLIPNMATVEHLFPKSALKPYEGNISQRFLSLNIVNACYDCNNGKGDKDVFIFAQSLPIHNKHLVAFQMRLMKIPNEYIELIYAELT